MKSTMFLNTVTCIDHAFIDHKGNLIGGSYNPVIKVSGEIDEKEKVVVDFSTVKKDIKNIIDDKDNGFDHKLWWIEGFSKGTISYVQGIGHGFNTEVTDIIITTDKLKITCPRNAVKIITAKNIKEAYPTDPRNTAQNAMEEQVKTELSNLYPKANIGLTIRLQERFDGPTNPKFAFRYTHGLKDSTSWGCQNIAHGHYSFISTSHDFASSSSSEKGSKLLENIAFALNNTTFVNRENLIAPNKLAYTTCRGYFEMEFFDMSRVVVLDTETTIEFLAEYIKKRWKHELQSTVSDIYVSEGLNKGAFVDMR